MRYLIYSVVLILAFAGFLSAAEIHDAIQHGDIAVVKALLESDPGLITAVDEDGWTLLHEAAYGGHSDLVELLLSKGADINAATAKGVNALGIAGERGHTEIVRILLKAGMSPLGIDQASGNNLLHAAAQCSDTAFVALALNAGVPVNSVNSIGETPLAVALFFEDMDVLRQLIRAGADVNVRDNNEFTPLWRAITTGSAAAISLLLENGARTDIPNKSTGNYPLHLAVLGGDKNIVAALLQKNVDVNITDDQGRTPLDYAHRYGHKQIARLLQSRGAISKSTVNVDVSSTWLDKPLGDKEAVLWYLGHCGYAIKTKNHVLIFDYVRRGIATTDPGLANGHVNVAELAGRNVTVFVTHEHTDHYDATIYGWLDSIPNLTYVFGFQPEQLPERARRGYSGQSYEYVAPRSNKTIGDIAVTAVRANDAGAGFVVRVDGLTIYHAGDHAGWLPNKRDGYTSEIDYIADNIGSVDVVFANATGCHMRDTVALAEGTEYTLAKLEPKVMIPTHAINGEAYYAKFAEKMKPRFPGVIYFCPLVSGDAAHYIVRDNQPRIETL